MDVYNLVKPLWHNKHETARKALNRIGIVLKYAAAMGLDVNLNAVPLAKVITSLKVFQRYTGRTYLSSTNH